MRSQIQFVMHPDDEREFVNFLLADPTIQFIDGPRWPTEEPTTTRELNGVGWYCIIWSPNDLAKLTARYVSNCNDWYCKSEYATLQFLRSRIDGTTLTDGRIAVSTNVSVEDFSPDKAKQVDGRFNKIRRYIKQRYTNSIIRWYSSRAPVGPATKERSANPGKPDKSMWVGPAALSWFHQCSSHCIKSSTSGVIAQIETMDLQPRVDHNG
jgi:hypothetical protein